MFSSLINVVIVDAILYSILYSLAGQILLPEFAVCLGVKAFLRMCHLKYSVVMKTNAEQMSPSGETFLAIVCYILLVMHWSNCKQKLKPLFWIVI